MFKTTMYLKIDLTFHPSGIDQRQPEITGNLVVHPVVLGVQQQKVIT